MNTVQNKLKWPSAKWRDNLKGTVSVRLRFLLSMVILILVMTSQNILGQGVGISEVNITPDISAILELRSVQRGLLVPRMTSVQRMAIASPAQGLLVYDTTTKTFFVYDAGWKAIAAEALGTSNQLLGMNAAGSANEYKTLSGTSNQVNVSFAPGSITLSTPQDIHTGASPVFVDMTLSGLTPNTGVYTNGANLLTSTPPTTGILGYWQRLGTTLSPTTAGDAVTTSGNISTTGTGTITSAGLLTGSAGATISGGAVNLNAGSNNITNINTGTSTGNVSIGGSGNSVYLPKFTTAGVVHNDLTGLLTSSLIAGNDITNGTIDLTSKVTGVLPVINGGTGYNNTYTSGQLLIGNAAGGLTRNTLTGTINQVLVTNGDGTITLSTPQDINLTSSPTFAGLTITGLLPNAGVYTDAANKLTSTPPTTGILGYWQRLGTTLSPTTAGDAVTTTGNISATGTGAVSSAGLLTGTAGIIISGGAINLNAGSNFITNINTGLSTGNVNIGGSGNSVYLPKFTTAGLVHNDATGLLSSSLIVNGDIAGGTIDLTQKVTGVLPIANGGTNSSTVLNNNRLMISSAGSIVEEAAMTDGQLIVGKTGAAPQLVPMSGEATINNTGVLSLSTTGVATGTYGSGTHVSQFTVDSKGRITFADSVLITGTSPVGSALTNGTIWIGDATNFAQERLLNGDISMTNNGVVTVERINGTTLGSTAATDKNILVADGTKWNSVAMTGDITIDNAGLTAIGNGKVTNSMLAGSITNAKLVNSSITIGTTNIALGASSTTFVGLTSVTSTSFTGALTGNATTSTTSTNLSGGSGGSIPYQTAINTTAMLSNGLAGQVLTSNGTTLAPSWTTPTNGTVTSVGLSLPSFITVTNSPVTGSGTLTGTLASQGANTVFAAPDGIAGTPSFRTLTATDIPGLDWTKIISGKPTTLAGYGITDASLATHNHTLDGLSNVTIAGKANNDILQWNGTAWVNKTLTGAGIITSETDPIVKAINGIVKSNGTTISAASSGTDYSLGTSALATGILKSTTGTGALTIAVPADFPTLNQNTTGTASNVTGTILIANGGTGQVTQQAAINALSGGVTSGQYLRGNGTNIVLSGIQAGDVPILNQNTTGNASTATTATNLSGGLGGSIPYQTAVNSTTMLANGLAGQVLTSNGTTLAPSWTTPANGTVTTISIVSANGLAGTVANPTTTPAITLSTTVTGLLKGNGTSLSAASSGTDYSLGTSALATGILKSTTGTGALTIAVPADFPTLNQNTTGTASNVTGTILIANGGTGQVTQQAAINTLAGAVTSGRFLRGDGTNVSMSTIQVADVPTLNQNTTGTALNVTGIVSPANGGTGVANNAASTIAISGNFGTTLTVTGVTALTLPTSGTLLTTTGNGSGLIGLTGGQITGNIAGNASNVTGTVGIANGGTGSTTAAGARGNLGAAASGANTDITSVLLNQTGLVVKGATANALTIKPNETYTAGRTLNIITGDATRTLTFTGDASISGINTGDQDLSGLLVKTNNLSDLTNLGTARTNLGLGTLATQSGTFSGTSSGSNTGDITLTAIGSVPNANGASLAAGQVLTLQPADATFGGVLTAVAQTIAGAKTWSGLGTFNLGLTSTGGAVNLNNDATANGVNIGTSTNTGSVIIGGTGIQTISIGNGAGNKTVNLGSTNTTSTTTIESGSGGLNIGTGAVAKQIVIGTNTTTTGVDINSGSGGVDINTGINQSTTLNGGTSTGTVNIANGTTGGNSIIIGNLIGATSIVQKVGTGNFSLDGVAGSTYNIGASTTTGSITIGGTAQTGNFNLGVSTGAETMNLATGGSGVKTVHLADGATANIITIGSTSGVASTTINAGTAGVTISSGLKGGSAIPGAVMGTGSNNGGGSPSATIVGTNLGGRITIVTSNTAPTSSGPIVTVTMANSVSFPNGCSVQLMAGNSNAAGITGANKPYITATDAISFTFSLNGAALASNTTYVWYYQVIGY